MPTLVKHDQSIMAMGFLFAFLAAAELLFYFAKLLELSNYFNYCTFQLPCIGYNLNFVVLFYNCVFSPVK